MKEDETNRNVYEDGSTYSYSSTEVLTATGSNTIKVRKYEWLLKYTVSNEAEVTMVQVFADFTSRYSYSDKTTIDVTVEAEDKKVTEQFDIEKTKDQCFTVNLAKNGFADVNNEDIRVTCTVSVTDIKYCAEFIGTIAAFTLSSRPHDVVLLVGEKKFYVHKVYLATWSRYFNTLFYGNFAEKDKKEVKIDDVDAEEFEVLLKIIHPDMELRICDKNVVYLLKLADRFDMPSVLAMCGNLLLKPGICATLNLMDRLELSDKYSLSQLQDDCLIKIHQYPAQQFKDFLTTNRERIRKLSKNTLQNLI